MIVSVPGLTGLVSSFVVVYVLGGLVNVIDSMDMPYNPEEETLVNSDLSVLEYFLFHSDQSNAHSQASEAALVNESMKDENRYVTSNGAS